MKLSLLKNVSNDDLLKLRALMEVQDRVRKEEYTNRGEDLPGIVYNVDFQGKEQDRGVISIHTEELENFEEREPLFELPKESMEAA